MRSAELPAAVTWHPDHPEVDRSIVGENQEVTPVMLGGVFDSFPAGQEHPPVGCGLIRGEVTDFASGEAGALGQELGSILGLAQAERKSESGSLTTSVSSAAPSFRRKMRSGRCAGLSRVKKRVWLSAAHSSP